MLDDLTDGMRHAADECEGQGNHLQASYLRRGADRIDELERAALEKPLTRAERRWLAERRREESTWRTWLAMTPEQQDHQRLRSLARERAAFALSPIMQREGLENLQMIAAAELADAAVEAFERVMRRGMKPR